MAELHILAVGVLWFPNLRFSSPIFNLAIEVDGSHALTIIDAGVIRLGVALGRSFIELLV